MRVGEKTVLRGYHHHHDGSWPRVWSVLTEAARHDGRPIETRETGSRD